MIKNMTQEQLKAISPYITKKNLVIYTPLLDKWLPYYSINTKLRIAAFIAQVMHESGSFGYTTELASGSAYDTGRLARKLGNTPQKDGDGQKYKGRGLIQITGLNNYKEISKWLGVDFVSNPLLLAEPNYAVQSACWWWNNRKLNLLADNGEFKKITKVINGGTNGYSERLSFYKKALSVL